jgi:hypothetical protein
MRSVVPIALRLLVAAFACTAAMSCGSLVDALAHDERPIPNDPKLVPVMREAVAPELLPAVGSDGLFRYPVPSVSAGEMPLDTALSLASVFLDWAQNTWFRLAAEQERGAFIEMGKLTACGQIYLVRSKYEPPPDSVHRAFQTRLGDHWSIPFCGGFQGPDVVVTVATRNTVRFQDGRPTKTPTRIVGDLLATEYVVRGLPWWWEAEQFVTPEDAVNEAFTQTGIRVRALPELLRSENLGAERINGAQRWAHVACSVWRVKLERALTVTTPYTNRTLSVGELYAADSDCPGTRGRTVLLTPWSTQPTTREYPLILPDSTAQYGRRLFVYTARLREPVDFETVSVTR